MKSQDKHHRYFRIAGITVCVESKLDFDKIKFKEELMQFSVDGPGNGIDVTLHHEFELPSLEGKDLGKELYRKEPWLISRTKNDGTWYYRNFDLDEEVSKVHRVAVFNSNHTYGKIHNTRDYLEHILIAGWPSLSLFTTDQIWLAPLLADRKAVLMHSSAVILNGQGFLFVGHSDAGKSTTVTMLKDAAKARASSETPLQVEILCDDRNVVRDWDEGWRVHGTWSHGTVSDVSPASAPLRAILFLKQDTCNQLTPVTTRKEVWKHLLGTLIKPLVTSEWWQKELDVLESIVDELPCYWMQFDKSGAIVDKLMELSVDVHSSSNHFITERP